MGINQKLTKLPALIDDAVNVAVNGAGAPALVAPIATTQDILSLFKLELDGLSMADRIAAVMNIMTTRPRVAGVPAGLFIRYQGAIAGLTAATTQDVAQFLVTLWNNRDTYKMTTRYERHGVINNTIESQSNLHFVDKDDRGKTVVKTVDVDGIKTILKSYGKMRFDTRFIRNLFWLANLQRVLRLKLRRDLTWYNTKVVSDHATLASSITETYDHDYPTGPTMTNYKY
jgi:hypothetical protein